MRLFHIANNKNAETILKDGFRDNTSYLRSDLVEIKDGFGNHRPDAEYTGVWVSDEPFEGFDSNTDILFTIEIPEDVIGDFQWFEDGELFRKWLIPAAILNSYGPPLVTDKRDDEIAPNPNPGAFMGDFDMGEFLWMDKPADWMDK